MRCLQALIFVLLLIKSTLVIAEDSKDYAKAALNGFKVNRYAKHIAVPFDAYFNLDYGKGNTQSIYYLKPVVPLHLTNHYDLVIRTIAPIYERTPTYNPQGVLQGHYINGWGDLNPTFFITPAGFEKLIYGFGPSLSIPTSTNSRYIGTGKWSIGPELALYYFSDNWILGCLTDNLWSFAGDPNRPSVNTFEFQYLISYVFDKGWYISTNPSITANWFSPSNQRWIVPFGIGGGRAMKFGHQALSMTLSGYYNAVRPAQLGPNWQIQFEIQWLFKSFLSDE